MTTAPKPGCQLGKINPFFTPGNMGQEASFEGMLSPEIHEGGCDFWRVSDDGPISCLCRAEDAASPCPNGLYLLTLESAALQSSPPKTSRAQLPQPAQSSAWQQ
ncbi:hypothetical protein JZ751_014456 [Albula glossodonta]|uniref:Uncharacterized protein n=1 Tax=Albula glossodonta TaxID=121402 RepID=A0A8T2MXM8_9TELE|nr:hypothetical protein JZ751_014456 [Albula glossodonta]